MTLEDVEKKMEGCKEYVMRRLNKIRSGSITSNALHEVVVDLYGQNTPLRQIASSRVSDALQLMVQPYDPQSAVAIKNAILKSDMGVQAFVENGAIRVTFPIMSQERRKELVKNAKKIMEEGKDSIRAIRRDSNSAIDKMKKENEATEDDVKKWKKRVQELTDSYCKEIETIFLNKEDDILSV